MPVSHESSSVRRFLVTWRDPDARRIAPVGVLTFDGTYRFHYLRAARDLRSFKAFPNFPELDQEYVSPYLFPFFSARVMDRRRSDFGDYCAALALSQDADDLDLLARSGGWRQGDRVAVTEEPAVAVDGSTSYVFLVRGIGHCIGDDDQREALLASLSTGDRLDVVHDKDNKVNRRALLLTTSEGGSIGWVPDALVDYVGAVVGSADGHVTVRHRSGPEQPSYLQLVVEVRGHLPAHQTSLPALALEPNRGLAGVL